MAGSIQSFSKVMGLGKDSGILQSGVRTGYVSDRSKSGVRMDHDSGVGFIKHTPPGDPKIRSTLFTNPLFDPGSKPSASAMASAQGGGDQGGSGEDPTRQKPRSGRALLLEGNKAFSDGYVVEEVSSSNWHAPAREGLGADEDDLLVGEVDMEDDAFVEEEPYVDPAPAPAPWRLMERYLGQTSPSAETLKVHFTKDVPWDKQTDANGRKWGSKLGKVVAVDADKSKYRDFLCVRIEILINKRLQTKITTRVKDRPETHSTYILRYERVPYFCFWCGFVGHNDTICEKKRLGVTSLGYDESLRCSPMRKYEYRPAVAPPAVPPLAKRGLDFSSSGDNSETLGIPMVRVRKPAYRYEEALVPQLVDAQDGFKQTEMAGETGAECDFAVLLRALQVQYSAESLTSIRERLYQQRELFQQSQKDILPVIEHNKKSEPSPVFVVHPLAVRQGSFPTGSADMIPALRGLSSWAPSESSADSGMPEVSSVLGKRMASQTEEESDSVANSRAILHGTEDAGNVQKRGRVRRAVKTDTNGEAMEGVEFLEATSHGAAGQLTGSHGATRQGQ
ncbi:hypothetical protein ACQ4PT_055111 [Festuca glaucescens]